MNTSERLVLNACAGLVGQLVTYPLDVIRRRMQMAHLRISNKIKIGAHTGLVAPVGPTDRVENMREVLRRLYKSEGIRGLTKGYSLNILKGPITLSISLTVYDVLQEWIKKT